jgi:hypothetical protein
MLGTLTYPEHFTAENAVKKQSGTAISCLLSAAVINRSFRETLLTDPDRAISEGFSGIKFDLDDEERELILSIQAQSLQDFAVQLITV